MEEKKSTEPQISIVQRMLLYVRIANSFSDNSHFSSRRIVFIQKYPRNFTSSLQQLKVHLPQPNIKFLRLIRNHPYDRRFPQKCFVNSTFLQSLNQSQRISLTCKRKFSDQSWQRGQKSFLELIQCNILHCRAPSQLGQTRE